MCGALTFWNEQTLQKVDESSGTRKRIWTEELHRCFKMVIYAAADKSLTVYIFYSLVRIIFLPSVRKKSAISNLLNLWYINIR